MTGSEADLVASEVAEWEEHVAAGDAAGWDSIELERDAVSNLSDALGRLARLRGAGDDPRARELAVRLAGLDAEVAESTAEGERWAEAAVVTLDPVGADVIEQAERYFGSPQGYRGVEAYCRHRLTNYDALLKGADRFCGRPRDVLHARVNASIAEALGGVGFEAEASWVLG